MINYLVIDIGGTTVKYGIFQNQQLTYVDFFKTPKKKSFQKFLKDIKNHINHQHPQVSFYGVCVSIPGILSNGYIKKIPNIYFKDDFSKTKINNFLKNCWTGCNILTYENDANLALIGECIAETHKNVCYISVGTGIGGSILVNGELVKGSNGMAGEFGHFKYSYKDFTKCGCGSTGCFELYFGSGGIIKFGIQKFNLKTDIAIREIIEKANLDDKIAKKLIKYHLSGIALLILNIDKVINPDLFIIGGGISEGYKNYICDLKEMLPYNSLNIKLSTYKNQSALYGGLLKLRELSVKDNQTEFADKAIQMVINHVLKTSKPDLLEHILYDDNNISKMINFKKTRDLDNLPSNLCEAYLNHKKVFETKLNINIYSNNVNKFLFIEEISKKNQVFISFEMIQRVLRKEETPIMVYPFPENGVEFVSLINLMALCEDSKSLITELAFSKIRINDDYITMVEYTKTINPNLSKFGLVIDTDSALENIGCFTKLDYIIIDIDSLFIEYETKNVEDKLALIENEIREAHQILRYKKTPHFIKYNGNEIEVQKKLSLKGMDDILKHD